MPLLRSSAIIAVLMTAFAGKPLSQWGFIAPICTCILPIRGPVSIERGSPVNWVFHGPLLISFNQPGRVPPERWQAFTDAMANTEFTHCIGTGLGAIEVNTNQRRDATRLLKSKRVVVVVDHAVARGIVTALSWLGLSIKAYGWDRIPDAVKFLELPRTFNTEQVVQAVLDLRDASLSADSFQELVR